jgi:integrase/recombinase XerD
MPIERGYSSHTCETYAHAFRLLFVFASERLGQRPSQLCLEHIDAALVLNFLTHIEQQRGNDATTRNSRLAAIKAFMRYVEFRLPSALEQVRQIHAIPIKRHDQALVQYLTMGEVRASLTSGHADASTRPHSVLNMADVCMATGNTSLPLFALPLLSYSRIRPKNSTPVP